MTHGSLQTEFDSPQASPGFLLWQISNKWQGQQREALKMFDLTHVQFVLLASIVWASSGTSFTQKALASHAQVDEMMASQVLRTLERKRLITRTRSKLDGRAFVLHPTPAGTSLANQAVVAVEAVDKQFFAALGHNTPKFTSMMQQLASSS